MWADFKVLDLEPQFGGALVDAVMDCLAVAHGERVAIGQHDLNRGDDAAELLPARTAQLRHDRAGQGIVGVAGGGGGFAHAFHRLGVDTGRTAQRVGYGRAGKAEGLGQSPERRGRHGVG